jgi:hypothetical protein
LVACWYPTKIGFRGTEGRPRSEAREELIHSPLSIKASVEAEKGIPMVRLIVQFLVLCLAVGAADALVNFSYRLATSAELAHEFDQLSYSKFTEALWKDKR